MKNNAIITISIFLMGLMGCKKDLDGGIALNKSVYFSGDTIRGTYTGVNGLHPKWELTNNTSVEGTIISYILPNNTPFGQNKITLTVYNRFKTKKKQFEKYFDVEENSWYNERPYGKTYVKNKTYAIGTQSQIKLTFSATFETHSLENPVDFIIEFSPDLIQTSAMNLNVDTLPFHSNPFNCHVTEIFTDLDDSFHRYYYRYAQGNLEYKLLGDQYICLIGNGLINPVFNTELAFKFIIKKAS